MQKPFRRKEKEKNRNPRTVSMAKVSLHGGGEVCGGREEKTGTGDDREALSENAPQFILTIFMKTGYNIFRNKLYMHLISE